MFVIIAESALELVPESLWSHPSVLSHTRRTNKPAKNMLLDVSWHFAAMKDIQEEFRRGRPDLIYLCLHTICSTPLFLDDKIKVYVHTLDNNIITIHPGVRLPRSYHRFIGIIEQLYRDKIIQYKSKDLLDLKQSTLNQLLDKLKPTQTIGFTTQGKKSTPRNIVSEIDQDSCIIIGGFQKGHFNQTQNISRLISIDEKSLDAHVVLSRILYEYEILH